MPDVSDFRQRLMAAIERREAADTQGEQAAQHARQMRVAAEDRIYAILDELWEWPGMRDHEPLPRANVREEHLIRSAPELLVELGPWLRDLAHDQFDAVWMSTVARAQGPPDALVHVLQVVRQRYTARSAAPSPAQAKRSPPSAEAVQEPEILAVLDGAVPVGERRELRAVCVDGNEYERARKAALASPRYVVQPGRSRRPAIVWRVA